MILFQRPNDLPKEYYEWFNKFQKIVDTKDFHKIGLYAKKLESFTPEELWKVTLNKMRTVGVIKKVKK